MNRPCMKAGSLKKILCRAVLVILTLFALIPVHSDASTATPVVFVYIEGIPGSSTVQGHEEWIEALSFTTGISPTSTSNLRSTGGGASQRPEFQPVTVTKPFDIASPLLAQHTAAGTHIPEVFIETQLSGSDSYAAPIVQVYLVDVVVTSVASDTSDRTASGLIELVSLQFGKIVWKFNTLNPDGSLASSIVKGWDVMRNAPYDTWPSQ